MSEYWVSTKKYWCKHCNLFVKDSVVSRQQHDATPRHQGALKRFLRELHKTKKKEASAAEALKREAERLNNLDNPDYKPPPSTNRKDAPAKAPASTHISEEQKRRNMDELAAMGVAMPESYRKEHAMMGEWEEVRVITRRAEEEGDEQEEEEDKKPILEGASAGEKRKLDEDEEGEREMRRFKFQTKTYPVDENDDTGAEMFSFKKGKWKGKQKAEKQEEETDPIKKEDDDDGAEKEAVRDDVQVKEDHDEKPADVGVAFKKRKAKNNRRGG